MMIQSSQLFSKSLVGFPMKESVKNLPQTPLLPIKQPETFAEISNLPYDRQSTMQSNRDTL